MKRNILFAAALALMTAEALAQNFTVKGEIPGIQQGCKVTLKTVDGYDRHDFAEGTTTDGGFVISGTVDRPLLVNIRINDKPTYGEREFPADRGVNFMLCEGETRISAEHFSKVPRNYEIGDTPLKMERNVVVEGGEAQKHYQEWRNYILDAEMAAWHIDHVAWKAQFGNGKTDMNPPGFAQMKATGMAAGEMVEVMNREFVKAHPTYAISLMLVRRSLSDLFTHTQAELDNIVETMKDNEDPMGYQQLKEQIAGLKPFTQGTAYTDLALELPDGTPKRLSDYIVKGKLNFIDFWASWCGPCRAAIPSVKEMHRKLGDKVNILSLSVDNSKEAWHKAMNDEQMPWQQLLVPKSSSKAMTDAYQVHSIPYLMLIDGDGRVIFTTHDADKAHEEILKQLSR
ncbi:MAG: AhpC/TSA family protein [Prevotella sp.]|nr:AhpC/TSA family protein [Prevotella sp.]MBR1464046.1 AhpC/TSA family protein [Prevotella sp.]